MAQAQPSRTSPSDFEVEFDAETGDPPAEESERTLLSIQVWNQKTGEASPWVVTTPQIPKLCQIVKNAETAIAQEIVNVLNESRGEQDEAQFVIRTLQKVIKIEIDKLPKDPAATAIREWDEWSSEFGKRTGAKPKPPRSLVLEKNSGNIPVGRKSLAPASTDP